MPLRTPFFVRRRAAALLLAPALVVAGASCSTQGTMSADPLTLYETTKALESAQLRLNCELACKGSWEAARAKVQGLHQAQLWPDLAVELVRVGYSSDLGYYYLARAAEGLGKPAAAEVYFKLALAADSKCKGLVWNSCDGIDVPAQARAGLARAAAAQAK